MQNKGKEPEIPLHIEVFPGAVDLEEVLDMIFDQTEVTPRVSKVEIVQNPITVVPQVVIVEDATVF